jgi:predicted nucleic acid-binding protein
MNSAALPSAVYLESSTAAAALIAGIAHANASRAFCAQLAAHGTRVYFSPMLRLEVAQTLRNLVVRRPPQLPDQLRQDYGLAQWETTEDIRETWYRFGHLQLEAFFDQFRETVEVPFRLRDHTLADCHTLMVRYNLKSYDALHLAIANEQRLDHFVTADREFRGVSIPRIWLTRDPPPS